MSVDPQALIQMLSQGGGPGAMAPPGGPPPPPEPPPEQGYGPSADPLEALQSCIQDLHGLITVLPDATHTQLATQALGILAKIQRDLMGAQQQTPLQQRLAGAAGG